jgi:glycosyltransferase involved in cell wall biosynthesis
LNSPLSEERPETEAGDARFDAAVIIPANNEELYIRHCLNSLMSQDNKAGRLQIIVAANACTDHTEDIVRSFVPMASTRGWQIVCQSSALSGKAAALNRADKLVRAPIYIYLDADVACDADMVGKIRDALSYDVATYAAGRLLVAPARTWVTRVYGSVWSMLPFVTGGATGAGLFAVNAKGRERWSTFPQIIADDHFVRLNFKPSERIEVSSSYTWPMVEGFANLVRVRRRQDAGVKEVHRVYPLLAQNEAKPRIRASDLVRVAGREPLGFIVYCLVQLMVRTRTNVTEWSRGR